MLQNDTMWKSGYWILENKFVGISISAYYKTTAEGIYGAEKGEGKEKRWRMDF